VAEESRFLVALALIAIGASSAAAADLKTGIAAYEAGDYAKAQSEWQPLADQGHVEAMFNVGLLHHHGKGLAQDQVRALEWYRKSAELGYARAQYTIAEMYDTGDGIEQDLIQAHLWFKLASTKRYSDAKKRKKQVAKKMDEHQIALADMHAREWKRKLKE
jgi:TPR repeat protein